MNRTTAAKLLTALLLTNAGNALAQDSGKSAVSIGAGLHPLGSVGPVLQYEYLRDDALAIGGRYIGLEYTYDEDSYHETGDGKGIEVFAHYYFRKAGHDGPYVGGSLGYFGVDWDWKEYYSGANHYGSGTSNGLEAAAHAGWKFPIGSKFFVDPSVVLGNFFSSGKDDSGEKENNLGLYGAVIVNFGLVF